MAVIPEALVYRSGYREERNHEIVKALITKLIAAGLGQLLFQNPAILTAFYTAGNGALAALTLAINDFNNHTNGGSIETIEAKMALVVIWIDSYADQVEVISNADANRTTQLEAKANIVLSGLPTQKIGKTTKGKPGISEINGVRFAGGIMKVKITNAHVNVYTSLTLIAVSIPPASEPAIAPAVVTVAGDQLSVTCAAPIHVMTKTIKGHPASASIAGANPALSYNLYVITQNGVKLVSVISASITLNPS
jgi:hypothetical protein